MGGMEFNKVFAAILVAGIIAMFAGFLADKLVHPHQLTEDAYPVEGIEGAAAGGTKEALPEPILALLATADVARGQKLSKACAACHSFDNGGGNGVGPNLYNIVGNAKQAKAGYAYSGVLNANGVNDWSYDSLNKFLWKPKKYAKGTKMGYAGMKKPADRAAMIAWLNTLGSNKAMPNAGAIAAEEAELSPKVEEAVEAAQEGAAAVKDGVVEVKDAVEDVADKALDAVKAIKAAH